MSGTGGGSLPLCLTDAANLWEAIEAYAVARSEVNRVGYVTALAQGDVARALRARTRVLDMIHGPSLAPDGHEALEVGHG